MRKPTFILKPSAYKTDKLYALIPGDATGDLNVSSYVGNGTRVNKDGFIETVATDTPRIDYHQGVGLLLEPTRINQFLQSASVSGQFTGSNITATDSDSISPDGSKNADKVAEQTASIGSASKTTTLSSPTVAHAHSLFVKFDDSEEVHFLVRGNVELDSSTISMDRNGVVSTVSDVSAQISASGSEYYGNGWWRLWAVVTLQPTDTGATWFIYPATNDADRHGNVWLWGFQIEEGSFMTSYIPTTTVAVTRAYDVASITDIITPGYLGLATGSFFLDLEVYSYAANSGNTLFNIGSSGGQIGIYINTSAAAYPQVRVINTDASQDTYTLLRNRNKVLFNIAGDNIDVWVNGTKQITTAADFFFTSNGLSFSGQGSKWKLLESSIFNSLLTDTEAQAITR